MDTAEQAARRLVERIGELGQKKDPSAYWTTRQALRGDELALKNARNYGGAKFSRSAADW